MSDIPRLKFHACAACGTLANTDILICANCLGSAMQTVEVPASGTLVSWTTIRKPPLRFKAEGSYHVGVFDLDNGQRVSGRFLAAEGDKPGQRVVATDTTAASGIATFKVESHV